MRILSTVVFHRRQQIFNFRQFQTTTIRRNPISITPIQIPMDGTEQSLRQSLSEKSSSVEAQGNAVRALKASRAAKPEIDAAIELLNELKLEKSAVEKELQSTISGSGNGSLDREAFLSSSHSPDSLAMEVVQGSSRNLLEAVAGLVASKTLATFPQVTAVRVKLWKPVVYVVYTNDLTYCNI